MQRSKFTLNAFLIVVLVFSALILLVTVGLTNMADRTAINGYMPIEGTALSVRYSSLEKSGICTGGENNATLLLEGNYGYDWGAAVSGNTLYINEYQNTTLGFMLCQLDKINTETMEKEVLFQNAVLRGTCRSGELVCVTNYTMSSNYPDTNGLCRLYRLASHTDSNTVTVLWLAPETGEIVYSVTEENTADSAIEKKYLQHTLEEVKG